MPSRLRDRHRPGVASFLLTGALVVTGALGCRQQPDPAPPPAPAPAPAPKPSPPTPAELAARLHHGIDVSGHSGQVDWQALSAAGHSFAFVKATEGDDLEDPLFDQHWRDLKQVGLTRGAYHFYVTEDEPEDQARFFIETVTLEPGDLAPVVDVELIGRNTAAGLAGRLRTWLQLVEEHFGIKPIIYTSANFWDAHLTDDFGDYPLWVAEYEVPEPRLPKGWSAWHLWQWQGDAEVPGVEKKADLSHLNRAGPDLAALILPAR